MVVLIQRLGAVNDHEHQIRRGQGLSRPQDALRLDLVVGWAKTCRIDQGHTEAVDVHDVDQDITRCAGNRRDNRTRRAGEGVEQTRLADIRLADYSNLKTFADQTTALGIGQQPRRSRDQSVERSRQIVWPEKVKALFGKVDRSLESRNQVEERSEISPMAPVSVP